MAGYQRLRRQGVEIKKITLGFLLDSIDIVLVDLEVH